MGSGFPKQVIPRKHMPARVRLLKAELEPRQLHVSSMRRREDCTYEDCTSLCSWAFQQRSNTEPHQVSPTQTEPGKFKVETPAKVWREMCSLTAWKEGRNSRQFWSRNTRKGHPPPMWAPSKIWLLFQSCTPLSFHHCAITPPFSDLLRVPSDIRPGHPPSVVLWCFP